MAMALVNGLPDEYRALISALDALDSNENELRLEHVKARVLKKNNFSYGVDKWLPKAGGGVAHSAHPDGLPTLDKVQPASGDGLYPGL